MVINYTLAKSLSAETEIEHVVSLRKNIHRYSAGSSNAENTNRPGSTVHEETVFQPHKPVHPRREIKVMRRDNRAQTTLPHEIQQ
jgi:hypothetical protein